MEILDTNDRALIDHFVRQVIQMGFQTPTWGVSASTGKCG